MYKNFIFLLLILGLSHQSQYTPIPAIPEGLMIGNNPNLVIEVYYDILCPGSRESYNIFKTVLDSLEKDSFTVSINKILVHNTLISITISQKCFYSNSWIVVYLD